MGTNYYHRYAHCDCCGRYDERHICKSMVTFRGYRPDPDWPDEFTGPLLASWRQWKRELIDRGGQVWDEYGRQHDLAEFIAAVESTKPEHRRRQCDWVQEHAGDYGTRGDRYWLDGDGFSFYDGEFS